jgi:hypothetical protein
MSSTAMIYSTNSMANKPVVIDLGKTKNSKIKDLKRGGGKLMAEIFEATNQVRATFGAAAETKEFIPIVLIYKKKSRRRNGFGF